MRKLSLVITAAALAVLGLTPSAQAANYDVAVVTRTVGNCPSAISAVSGNALGASGLRLGLGVEVGRHPSNGGPCATPHIILGTAELTFVIPNGAADIPIDALDFAISTGCPTTACTRTQAFGAAVLPPGWYRLSGTVALDNGPTTVITGPRVFYDGLSFTTLPAPLPK